MKAPSGLSPVARAAYARAEAVLGPEADGVHDAVVRYVRAVDVAARARAEWERQDRPLLQVHGAAGIHPLLKIMREWEGMAADLGARLGLDPQSARRLGRIGHYGRPQGAVSARDRKAPPPTVLRSVPRDAG